VKKTLVALLKIGLSVAIVAYLVADVRKNPEAFANFRDQPKDWGLFVAACLFCAGAVLLTLIRWHYLVRALDVPCRMGNSLRIGLLSYAFNFAPTGIAGGDVIKAVMLSREHKNCRAKSVASVVVDRVIGLYMLFVVASAAILLTGFGRQPVEMIRVVCSVTHWVTVIGAIGIGVLMIPAITEGKLARSLGRVPRVGKALDSLIEAMRMYRRKPMVLLVAAVLSIGVHGFFAVGVYCIARGLPGNFHSLSTHFVIMPLSSATGVLPLSFGPFEAVLDLLYAQVPLAGAAIAPHQGFVVALGYRVITVLIALVGAVYCFVARKEVAEAMHEAEQTPTIGQGPTIAMSKRCPTTATTCDNRVLRID
jgi:glycosyltransferase 2 family protein